MSSVRARKARKRRFANQIELIRKLSGRINHIHLIDSDNTCHKDDNGEDETSAHPPFGLGLLNFDEIMPELLKAARVPHNWWTIDLCFWPDAWAATESCKKYMDGLVAKYGTAPTETGMPKELRVGMIGYGFMGRTHSNAYKRLNDFFPVEHRPVLKAVCARNAGKGESSSPTTGGTSGSRPTGASWWTRPTST